MFLFTVFIWREASGPFVARLKASELKFTSRSFGLSSGMLSGNNSAKYKSVRDGKGTSRALVTTEGSSVTVQNGLTLSPRSLDQRCLVIKPSWTQLVSGLIPLFLSDWDSHVFLSACSGFRETLLRADLLAPLSDVPHPSVSAVTASWPSTLATHKAPVVPHSRRTKWQQIQSALVFTPQLQRPGAVHSLHVDGSSRWVGLPVASDRREVLLTARSPSCCGAALGQHGDLSAEVVAVTADGRLLVLSVSAQEPLQHPSAPLTLHLGLHLQEQGAGKEDKPWKGQQTSWRAALCLNVLTSPFRKQYKTATTKPCRRYEQSEDELNRKLQIAQLGKCSEYFSMNNDGKIMTNFRLRQAVHHGHVWDLFPGEITWSQNGKNWKYFPLLGFHFCTLLSAFSWMLWKWAKIKPLKHWMQLFLFSFAFV